MEPIIDVNHLTKNYRKAPSPAVDDISFDVQAGEFFAFLGPNGAGKTTTISILTTTLSKTSGKVTIAGYDLEKEAKKVRRLIGVIFQNPSLDLELTAEENIRLHVSIYGVYTYRPLYRLMPQRYKARIEELAEVVGIHDDLFKKLKTFSGGMKRKLEILRSLMHRPKILFLDEPTQGLDAASRQSFWNYLQKVRAEENLTIFLTTHYLEEAEDADRVCIINEGKIAMMGAPDEIKNKLLLDKFIQLDASDRSHLRSELLQLGAPFTETGCHLKVMFQEETPQSLIAALTSPLTKLAVHQPTLEEAYMDLIERKGGDKR